MTRNELIEQNLGLVHACAKRFSGKGIDYDDLYSAGCLGLIKAIDRFDPDRGWQLSTYAVPVILGEIKLLFREGGTVKLSRSLKERSMRARKIADEYLRETGKDIRIEELAAQLGCDVYQAQEALNAAQATVSLSYTDEDGGGELSIPVPSPEENLTDRLSLREAMGALSDDDRRLILLRYYQHKTQSDTARQLGTTQVQISRREKKILLKMRAMLL
ncbi:MAG: sigma-70 family RNA polymerase sigma factor [Ruminococcus sp.]|nr:sigma-70 family RNA polymerase sigma factor [Ruminococcus sp.]